MVSLIADRNNDVWVSELVRLEFVCALHRRFRMKEISDEELNQVFHGFSEEYSRFNTKKVGRAVLSEAEVLVNRLGKTSGLRTLDSIHLATFNLFNEVAEMVFVVADDTLLGAAQSIGARVINPISGPQVIMPRLTNANNEK